MQKTSVLTLIMVLLPGFLSAGITLEDLDPPKSFPSLRSDFYQINSLEPSSKEPGFLESSITAPHAPYKVEGLVELQKLLREIVVIEKINRGELGSGFGKGAGDSVIATGKGFVNLFIHPVRSGKGIGKSAGKLGGKIGGAFQDKEEGEKTSFGEKVLGSSERELAKDLGVDVYTSNPYLQEILEKMAKARLGGKGAVIIGKILLPIAGLVSIAVTVSGVNAAADQFVNDNGRSDLYEANEMALLQLGFELESIRKLLNHSYYSPREVTYLRFYLEQLKEVKDKEQIFKRATQSKSVLDARKILYEAEMAASAAKRGAKFLSLKSVDEGLAVEAGDRLIFITPYDYLDMSELGKRVMQKAQEEQKSKSKAALEIWNMGKVTSDFYLAALAKEIRTKSWVFFHDQEER